MESAPTDTWLASCGGAIEPLVHKELWIETFGKALNEEQEPRSWLVVREGSWSSEFVLESELPQLAKTSEKFLKPEFVRRFLESSAAVRAAYEQSAMRFEQTYQQTQDLAEMRRWFAEYLFVFRGLALHYWGSQTEFLQAPESKLREFLARLYTDEGECTDALISLTTPDQDNIIDEESRELRRLAERSPAHEDILRHTRLFPWLFYGTFDRDSAVAFTEKRLKAERHMAQQSGTDIRRVAKEHRQKVLAHVANEEVERLSLFFQDIGTDRFALKGCWAGAPFRFLQLFEDIARRVGVTIDDLMGAYRADEIHTALRTGKRLTTEVVRARLDNYVLLLDRGALRFCDGTEAETLSKKLLGALPESVSELRGICASRGNAEGIVRVIRLEGSNELHEDWDSFQIGDIMVTTMTQPSMVPIIRKAKAVITDEGGITSHAAIICRELGIPCIVGTRIATRILRNGDHVTVRADQGVVEIAKQR